MASIDFGNVEKYFETKGFGFVSRNFTVLAGPGPVFFHINALKRPHSTLAQRLDSFDPYSPPYFWYQYEKTEKGLQVISSLDPRSIAKLYEADYLHIVAAIKDAWLPKNPSLNVFGNFPPIPDSIMRATMDILPLNERDQIKETRLALEAQVREVKQAEQQRIDEARTEQARIEEGEFAQLVHEIRALGFTQSRQVSEYIVRHRLGHRYKHISGVLQMALNGEVWSFNGGFPPKLYARLCDELGLADQGSQAKPRGFTSYKDIIG